MVQKIRQQILPAAGIKVPGVNSDFAGKAIVNGVSATVVTLDEVRAIRRTRFTITNLVVDFAHATDSGSVKVADMPDTNILYFGAEVNITGTKGGTSNGLGAATDINLALGTTATADSTLTGTDGNLVASTAITADTLAITWQAHSLATTFVGAGTLDSASNAIYINLGTGALSANDTLTLSGTIDIFWLDLGNITS